MWFNYALIASMVWGLNYAICEVVLEKISVYSFLAISMFVSALIFFVLASQSHLKSDLLYIVAHKKFASLVIFQILTFTLATVFICLSIQTSNNAPLSALIESVYPVFTLLFLYLFFQKNHFDWRFLSGAVLVLSGLCLIHLT